MLGARISASSAITIWQDERAEAGVGDIGSLVEVAFAFKNR